VPALQHQVLDRPVATEAEHADDRGWFLLGSKWEDDVWVLAPGNALEERRPVRLRWDFELQDGRRFTDERYATLRETSKQLIALIRTHSMFTGLPLRPSTVATYFFTLRCLLQWMEREHFSRFADLDPPALPQFQQWLRTRPVAGHSSPRAPGTVLRHLYLFEYLHRFGAELDDCLSFDPFAGHDHRRAAGYHEGLRQPWPYTPDSVAVILLQAAIDIVTREAPIILQAWQTYRKAAAGGRGAGHAHTGRATRALRNASAGIPDAQSPVRSVRELDLRTDLLYAACFVVLSYLVGPRVSEILHLKAGCVQRRCADGVGEPVTVIVGAIFKRQSGYHGRAHEWVAPPAAVQAVAALEGLSAAQRAVASRDELWLRRWHGNGATEWHEVRPDLLEIPSISRINIQLQRFAAWLGLTHQDRPWRLSTHQGRKTFARFAALRDRTCLFALAQQLGHRERAETDHGYAGSDYRLAQEIDAEILQQSVNAWEHMLAAPGLGGRAGEEIVANRPRFRGKRMKEDLASYARLLVDAGLVLGVCDWGFCVYREAYSACLGNAAGPNPARREPSTCARCKNFAVSQRHRPYWVEQLHRCERLLDEPALPRQTLRIVRARLDEARSLVGTIDSDGKERS
jgi:integrase